MMIHAPSGGVLGAANSPTFAIASGCWSPSFIARQYTGLSSGLAFPPNAMDANFSSVSFLCHFDSMLTPNKGSSGVTNQLIGLFSSTQTKFSQSSLSVSSTNQQFQSPTNTGYAFGTGDFTIEAWIYPNAFATANVWDFRVSANSACPTIYWLTGGDIRYFVSNADRITGGAASIASGAWSHVAVARTSTSTKMFVNGAQVGSTFSDSTNYTQNGFAIGNSNTQVGLASAPTNAFFAEARVTKGVCRYTTAFSVPIARFPDF